MIIEHLLEPNVEVQKRQLEINHLEEIFSIYQFKYYVFTTKKRLAIVSNHFDLVNSYTNFINGTFFFHLQNVWKATIC